MNFTATDVVPSLCAAVNQQAWEYALGHASPTARALFERRGVPLRMGADKFIGNAGPLWIGNVLSFKTIPAAGASTPQPLCVRSLLPDAQLAGVAFVLADRPDWLAQGAAVRRRWR